MKKILVSGLILFIFSFTATIIFAEQLIIRSNSTTAKTGVKINYGVPICQIDIQNTSIVTSDSLIFDIDNCLGYNFDFKVSNISTGSAPTTANISYRSLNGTQYNSEIITSGTYIRNTKSAYLRFTIPVLNTVNATLTGNMRIYK